MTANGLNPVLPGSARDTQFDVNITVPVASTTFGDNFTVQFQFDGRGSGAGYTEYIDEVNAWVW